LILVLILVLVGARNFREILRGLGEGISQFGKGVTGLSKEFDEKAQDAGKSLGGIYGRPAAEALTLNNQTAEFYDPGVFNTHDTRKPAKFSTRVRLWRLIRRFFASGLNRKI
jgi:Sec-independent protein translocase protein TatA